MIRTASLAALVVVASLGRPTPVSAADPAARMIAPARPGRTATGRSRFVPLGVGKSVVIDLPRDIKDVLVADPKIANAVVRSARRAYIIGVAVGQTNVFFFDAEGQQIAGFDIAVTRDLNGIRAALQAGAAGRRHRGRRASATASCCPASVASPAESQQAFDIATRPRRQTTEQGRQRHHRARPRPGHAEGDGRRGAARRHQAARHRPQRQPRLRHTVLNFNNTNPFPVTRQPLINGNGIAASYQAASARRCAPWSAPA